MKKFFFSFVLALTSMIVKADLIVFIDGHTQHVYNVEAATKWVYYTETESADAPVKKVPINEVFAYKIGDGPLKNVGDSHEKTVTTSPQPVENAEQSVPRQLDPVPAADNSALIAAYNNIPDLVYKGKKPEENKYTNFFIAVWGIEDGSVLSDNNIEIGFEKVYQNGDNKGRVIGNRIKITNKTGAPIYVDLASCYKIMNGNHTVPYFTNSVYNQTSGTTTGASLNLGSVASAFGFGGVVGAVAGGVSVGGASSQTAGISTAEQQILTIPAYSSVFLPGLKVSNGKEIVECYEPFYFSNAEMTTGRGGMVKNILGVEAVTIAEDKKVQRVPDMRTATRETLDIHPWVQTNYTPEQSPKHIGRIITYSTSPDFSTFTSLPVKMYMRGAYGIKGTGFVVTEFNDNTYEPIADYEHLIVGPGSVKK